MADVEIVSSGSNARRTARWKSAALSALNSPLAEREIAATNLVFVCGLVDFDFANAFSLMNIFF